MKLASLVGLATLLLLGAACTGDDNEGETDDPTATAAAVSSTATAEPGEPTSEVPRNPADRRFEIDEIPQTDEEWQELIAAAEDHADMTVHPPTVLLPGRDYELRLVDASDWGMIQLMYAAEPIEIDGEERPVTIEFYHQSARLYSVPGELYTEDMPGFQNVHAQFGDPDEDGDPTFAAYTARTEDAIYNLVFRGIVPTDDQLEDMLASIPQ